MNNSFVTILLSGAGQLGSRYLQGLAKCRMPLRIYVQDKYQDSLDRAAQRWHEVADNDTQHEVSFHSSLDTLPRQFEITIVASTADVRPELVGDISDRADVRYWVLEKVLAQSEAGLDALLSHTAGSSGAWVNTPRRMMPWHQQIKTQLGLKPPVTLKAGGGAWGLACNAVHFLDLFSWWTGETLQAVNTDRLSSHWFESKRKGNWEIAGALEASFSGGSRALLSCAEEASPILLEVSDGSLTWLIKESEGTARRSDGLDIPGRMNFQSEMSATLVESILENGGCDLPGLAESVALHRIFVDAMLEHWRRADNPDATFVPIT